MRHILVEGISCGREILLPFCNNSYNILHLLFIPLTSNLPLPRRIRTEMDLYSYNPNRYPSRVWCYSDSWDTLRRDSFITETVSESKLVTIHQACSWISGLNGPLLPRIQMVQSSSETRQFNSDNIITTKPDGTKITGNKYGRWYITYIQDRLKLLPCKLNLI